MHLYKAQLGWFDGLGALAFHGQRADVASLFNLTSIFQVAAVYSVTRHATGKLVMSYIVGAFLRQLTPYSEGHFLLNGRGGRKQQSLLRRRQLTPAQTWVLDPRDPRRTEHP